MPEGCWLSAKNCLSDTYCIELHLRPCAFFCFVRVGSHWICRSWKHPVWESVRCVLYFVPILFVHPGYADCFQSRWRLGASKIIFASKVLNWYLSLIYELQMNHAAPDWVFNIYLWSWTLIASFILVRMDAFSKLSVWIEEVWCLLIWVCLNRSRFLLLSWQTHVY